MVDGLNGAHGDPAARLAEGDSRQGPGNAPTLNQPTEEKSVRGQIQNKSHVRRTAAPFQVRSCLTL
jgi:hypothetical protein